MDQPITIVGGGIGGLAHAVALARRGIAATVLERAPALVEVGAGVQISPNGFAVLRDLGLGDALRAVSVRSQAVRLVDGPTARTVVRMPLGGRDYHMVHRAALVDLLAQAASAWGVALRLGTRVAGAEDGATATLRLDETTEQVAFAVGADGLNSVLRVALNGSDPAFFTGQIAWRAIIDADAPPEAQVWMGPGRHLVAYPLGQGRLNLVAVEERADWTDEGWHQPGDPDRLRAAFAEFAAPARDWLGAVDRCHLWGLFRHPVAPRWHGGAMALLGDAAHPTLPFLAQGANLALEDAWCLARALAQPDRAAALVDYQSARAPRVGRAIAAANANARNYHLRGASRFAAHAALRVAGLRPELLRRRFDWLYDHDVTARGPNGPRDR
ncbi:FAD-dependent monooxygenase [Maribius pontilimi]|uniref:FAD-dependent monooxygenase n=1 Tax=Palleronia pontilimi TaxID=1964209 RepID=A0A934IH46_9RHOB|nr:FAD-dependent monooxygenase [Palleronia pontilimi]MBJ3761774.1 FAD-dependent monooxygenase [Palleronia pontilimi]